MAGSVWYKQKSCFRVSLILQKSIRTLRQAAANESGPEALSEPIRREEIRRSFFGFIRCMNGNIRKGNRMFHVMFLREAPDGFLLKTGDSNLPGLYAAYYGPQYSFLHLMKKKIAINAAKSSVTACASQRPSVPRNMGRMKIIAV